jgi:ubiquinone/menaquinone biosynthesis C-methylase UbiE
MENSKKNITKLNLGCGEDIKEDFINLDIEKNKGVDIVWNLDKHPLPFKDNSAEFILCSHLLEHLNNPYGFMEELYRICKPDAVIDLRVPHFSICVVHADLTHKRAGLSYHTFGTKGFNKGLYDKFEVVSRKLNFTRVNATWTNKIFNPIINLSPVLYERFFCYLIPCSEIHFKLKVKK